MKPNVITSNSFQFSEVVEFHDQEKSVHHSSFDSELLNSENSILLEPALSCSSLLSLADSECMTDLELNRQKVSFDMAEPVQDDSCAKCQKYDELVKDKCYEHLCIFKDSLEKRMNIEKAELESEIIKLKLEKDKMAEENFEQIEQLCQEQELKMQHLRKEWERALRESETEWEIEREDLRSRLARSEEELALSNKQIEIVSKEKSVLFQELEALKSKNEKLPYEISEQELQHENAALQERLSEVLSEISVLKSKIAEEKHRGNMPQTSQAVHDKIESLLEANEKLMEKNKKIEFEKQEIQGDLNMFKEIIRVKENLTAILQEKLDSLSKEKLADMELNDKHSSSIAPSDPNEVPVCYKLMLLEKNHEIELLKSELEKLRRISGDSLSPDKEQQRNDKIAVELQKENSQLQLEVEQLNAEVLHLKRYFASAKEYVEKKRAHQNRKFTQVKAKLGTLEIELKKHQVKEEDLQQVIQLMGMDAEVYMKEFQLLDEQWRIKWKDIQKSHSEKVRELKGQIQILCRQLKEGDAVDIDIADVQREIMEASIAFGAGATETYGNIIYSSVKKIIDSKLSQMASKHEAHVNMVEKTWEQSTRNHVRKIKQQVKDKLKMKYEGQLKDLMKKSKDTENQILEFENKVDIVEKQLMVTQQVEMAQRQTIEKLHEELESQLQKEKAQSEKHKEEMSNLKELFEKRWSAEMKKVQAMQVEELKRLKDIKEKTVKTFCGHLVAKYEEKLKCLQDKYTLRIEEEKGREVQRHKEELNDMQLMFEKEKRLIVEKKEEESKRFVEALEKRYNQKLSELRKDLETKYAEKLQLQLSVYVVQTKKLEEELEKVNELLRGVTAKTSIRIVKTDTSQLYTSHIG